MVCLFCRNDSSSSRSVEHIIPQSLGNTTLILPPGTVCDRCNNYFARKLEKPFMDQSDIITLRHHEAIPSKKGRFPSLDGQLDDGTPFTSYRYSNSSLSGLIDTSPEGVAKILAGEVRGAWLPAPPDAWEEPQLSSRLLAKIGLEGMASRLVGQDEGLMYLAQEPQFDPVRSYARYGTGRGWPYHCRRIYDANKKWIEANGDEVQRIWEWDILVTEFGEWYSVLALFGLELTINMGERSIEGYLDWLHRHQNMSPLYPQT
ncbi:HNH endonuclease [Nonomuraea maritima]|uniref:HNH endonuclease n=2 Tax=Nonomuraea maritima TaxID=683260 RepID=A0A1G9RJK6_9ACTN|nr:HNH endonuclease [Nonomuraea maritima]